MPKESQENLQNLIFSFRQAWHDTEENCWNMPYYIGQKRRAQLEKEAEAIKAEQENIKKPHK